jgi:tripartite-type tricarboxylate transporter receptor subunit TctC
LFITHVPYKGGVPAMYELLGGQISVMFGGLATTFPNIRNGRTRALAISSVRRATVLPEVPTMAEAGLPGYEAIGWFALFAPAGTSGDIIGRVQGEVARAMKVPEFRERFLNEGAVPVGGPPAQLDKLVRGEIAMWARLVKEAKIKVD